MAKQEGMFRYSGTFNGVTTVRSRAYGEHLRKARTKFTLGKEMKDSIGAMSKANVFAKVFKDAIDPYRREFRDGMLWQRLVSLFKVQILEDGKADFSALEGQQLHKLYSLGSILSAKATVTQMENTLIVHVTSRYTKNPTKDRADGYQLMVIVLFVDNELQVESFSESAIISLKAESGEQEMRCTIPTGATKAIVVLKCNFSLKNKPMDLQKGMGMKVEKVVTLMSDGTVK